MNIFSRGASPAGSHSSPRNRLSPPPAVSGLMTGGFLAVAVFTTAVAAPEHGVRHHLKSLPQIGPNSGQILAAPAKPLTPAQKAILPEEDAPPPPHGYTEVEDSEAKLASFSNTVRTHLPLGLPPTNAQQKTNTPNNLPSHFSILGIPVKFNAPVQAPYQDEDAPTSYAGHPVNGQTNILINGDASPIH